MATMTDGMDAGVMGMAEAMETAESIASDARIRRMDRVAVLYAEITAATREFLRAVAQCDRLRDWQGEGFGSCAEWLAWRLGISRNTANEKVRVARALESLPRTSDAMARGEISFSKVRAVTRVATADSEGELLELARAGSTANLERVVRGWRDVSRAEEIGRERMRHATRRFSLVPDGEGMYVVRGRLTAEVGAALMRAIDAASDALFAEEWCARSAGEADDAADGDVRCGGMSVECSDDPDAASKAEAARRRADAVGLIAERALSAGLGADAGGCEAPVSGSRAERYQVMLHIEAATLSEDGEPGLSELEDGTRVSAETARRIACDAALVVVEHEPGDPATGPATGPVLRASRRKRTVAPAIRRALEARDRGCRFPGCGRRFTDAHHVKHWADGGATTLGNLVLLCRRHHRRVHEGGVRVCTDSAGQVVFFTPDGRAFADVPGRDSQGRAIEPRGGRGVGGGAGRRIEAGPGRPSPAYRLVMRNRGRDVDPRTDAGQPAWRWDRDIPWGVETAAWEALERAAE